MKKLRTKYVCQSCGFESTRWLGKCPNCESWNSFVEEIAARGAQPKIQSPLKGLSAPVSIGEVLTATHERISTGLSELDRVLGGGIVPGSVVLVGGDPGIGKSTLMLQMASALSSSAVLYVSGEESVTQIKLRSDRLDKHPSKNLLLLAETNVDLIEGILEQSVPDVLIVDSIQTMYRPALESAPGSVSQLREATGVLTRFAKTRGVPTFLVGHVTKEGAIAGPKVIEHMVDTVLQFEGERHHSYRILRATKNRFGSTNELGIFEMHDGGLKAVENPSQVLLSERRSGASGSCVVASMEGTRPLLVEVQALVAPASYGVPQRTANGFDTRRLHMLLAVLEKRADLRVGQYDVFVNVAGGVRIDEPAVDLGMALAIASSLLEVPVDSEAVVVGEVGLGGEIRMVSHIARRAAESLKLGFRRLVLPHNNAKSLRLPEGLQFVEVETIDQAVETLVRRGPEELPDSARLRTLHTT